MVSFSLGMAFLSIWLLSGALFFGANGRAVTERTIITSNDGWIIYYAADGSITRRSITNDSTTTFFDEDGRKISTITTRIK